MSSPGKPSLHEEIPQNFRINRVELIDSETQEVFWDSKAHLDWNQTDFNKVITAHIPKKILQTKEIIRKIEFSTSYPLENLTQEEYIFIGKQMAEEQQFEYGPVLLENTNQTIIWEQSIETAEPEEMLPEELYDGALHLYIRFLEQNQKIKEIIFHIFYQ